MYFFLNTLFLKILNQKLHLIPEETFVQHRLEIVTKNQVAGLHVLILGTTNIASL